MATDTKTDSLLAPVAMDEKGVSFANLEDTWRFAKMIITSGAAPKGVTRPEQVIIAIQAGAELGLTPLHALSNIPVINGRASIMGDAALALIRSSGKMAGKLKVSYEGTGDSYGCRVSSRRVDDEESTHHTFTVAQAKRARLWPKDGGEKKPIPWHEYPERMLYYRALGFHVRDLYSDVLAGLAITEEVRDYRHLRDSEPKMAPTEPDPLLAETIMPSQEPEPETVEAEVVGDQPDPRPYQLESPPGAPADDEAAD